jgi:hypothetical protein
VKPGGCADLETAFKIIDDLSEIIGTRPARPCTLSVSWLIASITAHPRK